MHQLKSVGELAEFLKQYLDRKALLTFHSIGDTDAVSSAVVLSRHMHNAMVVTPDIITSNSNRILDRIGFTEPIPNRFDGSVDAVILLDMNNLDELAAFSKQVSDFQGAVIIIDHHLPNYIDRENFYVFNNENYAATASIVYELIVELGEKISEQEAKLLLTGIISDSAELRNSTPETFKEIGSLLGIAKTDYYSIRKLMSHVESPEARARAIEDLNSAKTSVINGLLFVSGRAGAHANMSADNAIRLGADVAIFYTESEREVSFSARLNTSIDKRYNIHLGKVMRSIAHIIGGSGGGHPAAAGAYGPLKNAYQEFLDAFIDECVRKTGARQNQAGA